MEMVEKFGFEALCDDIKLVHQDNSGYARYDYNPSAEKIDLHEDIEMAEFHARWRNETKTDTRKELKLEFEQLLAQKGLELSYTHTTFNPSGVYSIEPEERVLDSYEEEGIGHFTVEVDAELMTTFLLSEDFKLLEALPDNPKPKLTNQFKTPAP